MKKTAPRALPEKEKQQEKPETGSAKNTKNKGNYFDKCMNWWYTVRKSWQAP